MAFPFATSFDDLNVRKVISHNTCSLKRHGDSVNPSSILVRCDDPRLDTSVEGYVST